MRRAALARRERPQLSVGVWQWLNGKPYEALSIGTRWDLLMLPSHDLEWCDRLREAVENGEIEVSEDKIHRHGDGPLLKTAIVNRGQRASRQERSEEAMERASDS